MKNSSRQQHPNQHQMSALLSLKPSIKGNRGRFHSIFSDTVPFQESNPVSTSTHATSSSKGLGLGSTSSSNTDEKGNNDDCLYEYGVNETGDDHDHHGAGSDGSDDIDLKALPMRRSVSHEHHEHVWRESRQLAPLLIDSEEDSDTTGLASYETSLGAKGRLAFRIHSFHMAVKQLFSNKLGATTYAKVRELLALPYASHDHGSSRWENEFVGLEADIRDLSSPDFEIGGRRKLATASRMRTSYRALSVIRDKSFSQ